jgi:hypothetical protein
VLPRALVNSRFIQFSGRCALQMFAFIDARHARQQATIDPHASRRLGTPRTRSSPSISEPSRIGRPRSEQRL